MEEEIERVKTVVYSALQEENGDISSIHIGEFIDVPNQLGCFIRKGKWYMYETDEKSICTFNGPFNEKGIVYACAIRLNMSKKLMEYKFTEEEFDIYLYNNFYSFNEIDNYENEK